MKKTITFALLLIIGLLNSPLWSGTLSTTPLASQPPTTNEQNVVLVIKKMTCQLCSITIRIALERVNGVNSAWVDYATKTAMVSFDPTITTIDKIAAAVTNSGYPAHQQ
ncbi:MAG: heavy-metal-associated domain-containing protein [Gammaproteobacteria bacterium]|nr:heavy-metal-associated domain-containing protein [Gammaproteobacteria bacterium]